MSSTPLSFSLTDVQSLASTRLVSTASCSLGLTGTWGGVVSLCENNGAAGIMLDSLDKGERVVEAVDEVVDEAVDEAVDESMVGEAMMFEVDMRM